MIHVNGVGRKLVLFGLLLGFTTEIRAQDARLKSEIEMANRQFEAALEQGSAQRMAARYTDDGLLLPPNTEMVSGRPAIEAFWKGAIEMGMRRVRLETVEVSGTGNRAYEIGTYSLYGAGDQVMDHGKYMVTWERSDGGWKLHRDMWSSNLPAPPSLARAVEGEEIGLAVWRIKPEKTEAFEAFVQDVLMPASRQLQPDVDERIRFWNATGVQEDGTHHYAFVFDPYVATGDYSMPSVLKKVHGEATAAQLMADFDSYHEGYTYTTFMQAK